MSFTKKRNTSGEGKRSRLFANQTVMFYNASSATSLVFCLCGSWLFNGWIETKWISFNHISHFFFFVLFFLAKKIVGKRKRESRTTFPKLLFFSFLFVFSFYLNIWGNNKKKKTTKQKENGRRASLDWMGKIILTTNNRKYEERGRDLSAARTNRWCGMKDGRYVWKDKKEKKE